MIHAAMGFYNEFRNFHFKMTLVTWTVLLDMMGRAGEMEYAERLFEDLCQSRVVKPAEDQYISMVKGYLGQRKYEKALGVYTKMIDAGIPESLRTLQTFTLIQAGLHQYYDGLAPYYEKCYGQMLEYFKTHGSADDNAQGFYQLLLHSTYLYKGFVRLAPVVSLHMKLLGLDRTNIYHLFVSSHSRQNYFKFAKFWVTEMSRLGIPLTKRAYDDFLLLLCRTKEFDLGLKLAQNYLLKNPPSGPAINTILLASLDKKKLSEQEFEDLLKEIPRDAWDSKTFSIIIQYYASNNNWKTAWSFWLDYLKIVKNNYISIRPDITRTILSWCIVHDEKTRIEEIWKSIIWMNPEHFNEMYFWKIDAINVPAPCVDSISYQEMVLNRKCPFYFE
jgi:pentatricopeptide repeat protein